MLVNITIQNFMIWTPYIIFMVSLLGRAMRKITIFKKMSGHNWKRLFSSWNQNSPKYISRVFSKFCAAKVPFLTKFRIQNFAHFFRLCIREKIFTWWQSHKKQILSAQQTLFTQKNFTDKARKSRQRRIRVKFDGLSGQLLNSLDSVWI